MNTNRAVSLSSVGDTLEERIKTACLITRSSASVVTDRDTHTHTERLYSV